MPRSSLAAIKAWLETGYPAIVKRVKAQKAAIFWGDETGMSNLDQIGRSWVSKGKMPERGTTVAFSVSRTAKSMISAVSNRGQMRFMFYEGALNANLFIAFLRRLIKDAEQKVFMIIDNLKVPHARKITA